MPRPSPQSSAAALTQHPVTSEEPAMVISDVKNQAMSLVEEFKQFAFKGNVVDLAIGVIIGAAFAKIVESLVKNIIMPVIGLILPGEQGYVGWKLVIGSKEVPYGQFLGDVVNFLLVTIALYLFIVKFLRWVMKTKAATPPPPTKDQELLTEIRDLLKAQAAAKAS
jgi:large conductance mechanosensitive channel